MLGLLPGKGWDLGLQTQSALLRPAAIPDGDKRVENGVGATTLPYPDAGYGQIGAWTWVCRERARPVKSRSRFLKDQHRGPKPGSVIIAVDRVRLRAIQQVLVTWWCTSYSHVLRVRDGEPYGQCMGLGTLGLHCFARGYRLTDGRGGWSGQPVGGTHARAHVWSPGWWWRRLTR